MPVHAVYLATNKPPSTRIDQDTLDILPFTCAAIALLPATRRHSLLSCIQSSLSAAKLWMCFMQQTCFVTHWHTQSYAALSLLFPSCGSLKSCTHIPSAPQLTVLSYKLTSEATKPYSSSCDGKIRCPANPVLSSQTLRANVSVTLRPLRWQTWNCCPLQVQDTKETR